MPDEFIRRDNTFCLRVKGDSMIEDGIRDGDYIIVEGRDSADNGETVVALIGNEATVKKFYRESGGKSGCSRPTPQCNRSWSARATWRFAASWSA